MSVSVLLVAFNNPGDVRGCLSDLLEHDALAIDEIVIVDHSTGIDCSDVASEFGAVYFKQPNVGFAAGANRAASLSTGAVLFFVNPDVNLSGPTIAPVLARFAGLDRWAANPLLCYPDGTIQRDAFRLWWLSSGRLLQQALEAVSLIQPPPRCFPSKLSGGALFIPRAIFDEVGGFDERFFLYGEDVDLSLRLRRSGVLLQVLRDVRIAHRAGSSGHAIPWLVERERGFAAVAMVRKHFGFAAAIATFVELVAVAVATAVLFASPPLRRPSAKARLARIEGGLRALA